VMGVGAMSAPIFLVLWARAETPGTYLGAWLGLGFCMAALYYEPAFAELTRVTTGGRARARSMGTITIAGGLASVVFVPLTTCLLGALGWRTTVLWLACILAVLTLVPHALTLPSGRRQLRPTDAVRRSAREHSDSSSAAPQPVAAAGASFAHMVSSAPFRRLGMVFGLTTLVSAALSVHFIPLLMESGHSLAWASAALAWTGVTKIGGRLLFTPVAERLSASTALAGSLLVQVLGLGALLMAGSGPGVAVAVVLCGAADGAATPARGVLVAEAFDLRVYGSTQGALAALVAGSRAAAPVGGSMVWAVSGDYVAVLWLAIACALLAFLAVISTSGASIRRFLRLHG
jgi:predicted MFS family arabinose efflux permease